MTLTKHLCLVTLTIAVPSLLDRMDRLCPQGVAPTHWQIYQERLHLLVYTGCIALASIPKTHLIQDSVVGVTKLIWLGALLHVSIPPSVFLLRRLHATAFSPQRLDGRSLSSALRQCKAVPFLWVVQQPKTGFSRI